MIFHGGPILTQNAKDEVVQALAVLDDKIVAVGKTADVLALKSRQTEVIDLKGRALLPGFVAAHEHPTLTAIFNSALNLSGFKYKTNAEVWEALRTGIQNTPKGEWCYGGGPGHRFDSGLEVPHAQGARPNGAGHARGSGFAVTAFGVGQLQGF